MNKSKSKHGKMYNLDLAPYIVVLTPYATLPHSIRCVFCGWEIPVRIEGVIQVEQFRKKKTCGRCGTIVLLRGRGK